MRTTGRQTAFLHHLVLTVATVHLAAIAAFGQSLNPAEAPSPATLARYDANGNGRLDPAELEAIRADERKRTGAVAVAERPAPATDEILEMSPFEVSATNRGYQATNAMSGTRLNSKLEDIASAISVVTKEQMADFAMLDLNDVFNYEASTEGMGNYSDVFVDRKGRVVDNVQDNPQGANRVRGMGAVDVTRNNFATSGVVPVDPLDVESLEIGRGPNANIFGIGNGYGTVNLVSSTANLSRPISNTQMRFDDLGGWRASLDLSRPVIKDKLALRVSGARQHDAFPQKPSGFDSKRLNTMLRVQPFRYTALRASWQTYRGNGNRPNAVTPRDGISYWRSVGSPTWDPVTSTVTVNGVKRYMGAENPAGLYRNTGDRDAVPPPSVFVDRDGIKLWTVSQLPAAGTTLGPNLTSAQLGMERLLESAPEPYVTRPLFSTAQGVNDKSLYDWTAINLGAPNTRFDSVDTTTIQLEQFLLHKGGHQVALQGAWFREDADRFNFNLLGQAPATGQSNYLSVDVNERLLDGRPNPFFLRPYIGVMEGIFNKSWAVRDVYRGQLAYLADFTGNRGWSRWIGRHHLLGYYEFRDDRNYNYGYRHGNATRPGNPAYVRANQVRGDAITVVGLRTYDQHFLGDAQGQNVDYAPGGVADGQHDFVWYDARARQWITDRADFGTLARSGSGNRTVIKGRGAMLQSSLLQDRVVLTLGKRIDENRTKRYNAATFDRDRIEFDYLASERLRNENWTYRSGETFTRGIVVKPLRWFHAHYNVSESFRPATPQVNLAFELLDNPQTEGKDYGFSLNLFGGKLVVRANRYDNLTINTRAGQSATLATRTLRLDRARSAITSEDKFNLEIQANAWVRAMNPTWTSEQITAEVHRQIGFSEEQEDLIQSYGITETGDIRSKGDEVEVYWNPNSHWTAKLNVTRTNAFESKVAPGIPAQIARRMPLWTTIVDPRTNTLWWTTNYGSPHFTAQNFYNRSVLTPLRLAQAMEGKRRAQVREWRANLSSSYRLAGLTEQKHLKRMSIGGAIRWEDEGAIGYYGIPIDGDITAATEFDPDRPIWDSAHTYVDAFVTYSTRLFSDKVRARFQINGRNLQEGGRLQGIGAYPDGRPHTYRIINPRTFIFSASFDL